MICGTPKPHIPEFCCTGLLACCNKSDVVVGELAVVSVSYLNTDTVELGNLLLEVTNAEVATNGELACPSALI